MDISHIYVVVFFRAINCDTIYALVRLVIVGLAAWYEFMSAELWYMEGTLFMVRMQTWCLCLRGAWRSRWLWGWLVIAACSAPNRTVSPPPSNPVDAYQKDDQTHESPEQRVRAAWLKYGRREALLTLALWQYQYCESGHYKVLISASQDRRRGSGQLAVAEQTALYCPLGPPRRKPGPFPTWDDYWDQVLADADEILARRAGKAADDRLVSLLKRFRGYEQLAWLHLVRGDHGAAAAIQEQLGQSWHRVRAEDQAEANFIPKWAWVYWALGKDQLALQFLQRAEQERSPEPSVYKPADPRMMGMQLRRRETEREAHWSFSELLVSFAIDRMPNDPEATRLGLETVLKRKGRRLDVDRAERDLWQRRRHEDDKTRGLFTQLTGLYAKLGAHELRGPLPYWQPTAAPDAAKVDIRYRHYRNHQRTHCLMLGVDCKHPEYRYELDREELFQAIDEVLHELTKHHERHSKLPEVTLEHIRSRLPADAALIEFVRYRPFRPPAPESVMWPPSYVGTGQSIIVAASEPWGVLRYGAFVITPDGASRGVDLGPADRIDAAVTGLLEAIQDTSKDVRQPARKLYRLTMQKIEPALGQAHHLLLAPDGQLVLVPFAALIDERGSYLVERYLPTYLNSGRDLLSAEASTTESPPLLVFDPAFDASAPDSTPAATALSSANMTDQDCKAPMYRRWGRLAGTRDEADELRPLLPGSRQLSGPKANEAALKRVRSPRILHLATHGVFLQNPKCMWQRDVEMWNRQRLAAHQAGKTAPPIVSSPRVVESATLAGLVLAGANQQVSPHGEDGVLTALEISAMDLTGTKLVVLSACDTGLGEAAPGDGISGLRRAFSLAGAETLVTSLWRVDDTLAPDFMADYYKALRSGRGRGAAMRDVQLVWLRHPDMAHPRFWASFLVSGDPAALD